MDVENMQVTLTADAQQFNAELDGAKSSLTDFAMEEKSLKAQMESLQRKIFENAAQLQKYGAQCDKTKTQIENKKQKIEQAAIKYGENSTQVTRLKNELAKLEITLQSQTKNFQQTAEKSVKLGEQLSNARKQEQNLASQVKGTNDTLQKQQTEFAQTARQGQNMSGSLQSAFLMIKGLILGYAGKTLYETLIGSNADFEQSMTSFEVLLGSTEKADKLMSDMTDFAAKTPFEMGDLTQGAQSLLAFGTAEDDVIERMQQLGDLAQGVPDKFERITLAYGKMQAKGKVSLEELNMMTEAGIPILRQLAEQSGQTEEALFKSITAGKLNIDDINEAITSLTSEGGQFFGMMEKQSQTFEGMLSTTKDNINITLRQMGESAFDTLKAELADLLAEINALSDSGELGDMAADWGEKIGAAVNTIVRFIEILYNMRGALIAGAGGFAAYKLAASGLTALSSATATLNGLKNMVQMMTAAKKAGASAGTIYKAVIIGEAAAQTKLADATGITITTENGVKVAKMAATAATTAETAATEGATAATWSWNAALAANPFGVIAAAIGILVTAIIGVTGAINNASQAANEARQEAARTAAEYEKQSDTLDDLTQQYKELASQTNLDESAKQKLKSIQEQLIETYGAEAEGLDLVNGKYEEQIGILNDMSKEKAQETTTELYSDYYKSKNDLQAFGIDNLNLLNTRFKDVEGYTSGMIGGTMEERLATYKNIIDKAKELGTLTGKEEKTLQDVNKRYNELKGQIEDCNSIINQYNNASLQANYAPQVEALKDAQIAYNNALKEQDSSKIAQTKVRVDEAAQSLRGAVSGSKEMSDAANKAINDICKSGDAAQEQSLSYYKLLNAYGEVNEVMKQHAERMESLEKIEQQVNEGHQFSYQEIEEIKDKYAELEPYIQRTADGWSIEKGAIDTLSDGVRFTRAEMDELKAIHPELDQYIRGTGDELYLEKEAFDVVGQSAIDLQTAAISAEIEKTRSVLENTNSRISAYKTEIAAIKDVASALHAIYGGNSTDSAIYSSTDYADFLNLAADEGSYGKINLVDENGNYIITEEVYEATKADQQKMVQLGGALEKLDSIQKSMSTLSAGKVSGSNPSKSKQSKSKKDKSKDDAEKKEQERIKGLFENADRYRQMGWISEEKYWEEVTTLRDKYYAKNSDNWWTWTLKIQKHNEDVHKQMLSDIEDAHEDYLSESQDYIDKCNENGWGTDSEIEAYKRRGDRIQQYQAELLENEALTAEERDKLWTKANEDLYENDQKLKQAYLNGRNRRIANSEAWIDERNYYGDWDKYNDSEAEAWQRVKDANKADFDSGVIDWDTYKDYDKELDKNQREAKKKEFDTWEKSAGDYEKQREKYGDWEKYGDDEISFVKRKMQRLEEFYAQDALSYQEYADKKLEYNMELWDAVDAKTEDILSKGSEEYDKLKKELEEIEQKTKDAWDRDDRLSDIYDTQTQLDEFAGAVTTAGQQKYKELQDKMKELQREEAMYQLQEENNAILEDMDAKWEEIERLKNEKLGDLVNGTANIETAISAFVQEMRTMTEQQRIMAQTITNNYTNNNNVSQTNNITTMAAAAAAVAALGDMANQGG